MSLDEQNRQTLVGLYWNKSVNTFDELESAIKDEKWNMAANRMYYSVFHAVTALLVKDGHQVNSHRGIKGALGLYYVKTGLIDVEEARVFAQLATLRERADYDIIFTASRDDIMKLFPQTACLVEKIKSLLGISQA